MKKITLLFFAMLVIVSCEETEPAIFDATNGQPAVGFETGSATVTVIEAGTSVTLNVLSATRTNADRTIPITVDASSTGVAADYQLGTVTIPAGEHIGQLTVDFINFAGMADCVTYTLVLNLDSGTEAINGPQQFTFNYVRDFECPDLFLNITFDDYPGETSWQVTQGEDILLTGDNYTGDPLAENLCLCPGEYTFTIFDSFGDGICCAYGTGSYEIVYNGNVLISGAEFGADESQNFTVD